MGAMYGRIVLLSGAIATALMIGASLAAPGVPAERETAAMPGYYGARYVTFGLWTKRAVRL